MFLTYTFALSVKCIRDLHGSDLKSIWILDSYYLRKGVVYFIYDGGIIFSSLWTYSLFYVCCIHFYSMCQMLASLQRKISLDVLVLNILLNVVVFYVLKKIIFMSLLPYFLLYAFFNILFH